MSACESRGAQAPEDVDDATYERRYAAARYLDYLAPDGNGFLNIRHGRKQGGKVAPDKNVFLPADAIVNAAIRAIELADAEHDVYAAIAPRARKSGTKDAIEHCWVLFADVDKPDAHERLATLPPPSFTVASGGVTDGVANVHAYWRLDAPVSASELEAACKPLDGYLSAGKQHVHDASHILRIPGTVAYKYDDPRPVSFVTETDVSYRMPADVVQGLPDVRDQDYSKGEQSSKGSYDKDRVKRPYAEGSRATDFNVGRDVGATGGIC